MIKIIYLILALLLLNSCTESHAKHEPEQIGDIKVIARAEDWVLIKIKAIDSSEYIILDGSYGISIIKK